MLFKAKAHNTTKYNRNASETEESDDETSMETECKMSNEEDIVQPILGGLDDLRPTKVLKAHIFESINCGRFHLEIMVCYGI